MRSYERTINVKSKKAKLFTDELTLTKLALKHLPFPPGISLYLHHDIKDIVNCLLPAVRC